MRRRPAVVLAIPVSVLACILAVPTGAHAAVITKSTASTVSANEKAGSSRVGAAKPKKITGKALLGKLTVRDEHTRGYDRDKFQYASDADGDCQDTRAEVLQQESLVPVTFSSSSRCWVDSGEWVSWYDGRTWSDDDDLEIDHVVALSEAWKSGAWRWKDARLARYGNDLAFAWSLDAVTGEVNQKKSDHDPAEWLPRKSVRCKYARHWVAIKYRWKLSIDQAEKKKLSGILTGTCGATKLVVPARAK